MQDSIHEPESISGAAGVPGIKIAPTVEAPSFTGEPPQLSERLKKSE
jgi:hypothetical protein